MKRLTKAEEELMQLFWAHGPCTVSKLISQMEEPHPPHSSVSTIVRILEKKGFLDHKVYGRTHEYFPLMDKSSYTKFSLRNIISSYFEGSMNDMVSFLVEENDLSLNDLTEVIEKLKDSSNQKSK